jgi:molecular chaperone DnaK (HSP70)
MGIEVAGGSRYVVGIDLGTTNSAVGYVDMKKPMAAVQTFAVPQLVAPGTVERRDTLPSFCYFPASGEFEAAAGALPWGHCETVVGVGACERGAAVPGRLAVSAKSWLSHAGVDRRAALLPWHGAEDVAKASPGEVSSRYLAHLRMAWNDAHPEELLEDQDVVLTVPASFDEVARELTVAAARQAGLARICLLEEPQAAFYAWLSGHRKDRTLEAGKTILVCDVGGGTTDLTLIQTELRDQEGVSYRRIAVGDHLLLGGDNLDLALAHYAEELLGGDRLSPMEWSMLVRRCQQAKEELLGADAPEQVVINLPSRGRSVIGGSRQVTVARDAVRALLVDGFLPEVGLEDRPRRVRSGFQEFGLPYASDSAISRYVIAFLTEQARPFSGVSRPDYILFNGGFFQSPLLKDRLLAVLGRAFGAAPEVLDGERLDLAVAYGAAEYGRVRRGVGQRITGGLARSYYMQVGHDSGAPVVVCLLPSGLEEGASVELSDRLFKLHIRKPVEFPLFSSSVRTQDFPGAVVPLDLEQMRPMPSIKTVISSGKKRGAAEVDVVLHARLTEIGTMELWCSEKGGTREWRLQFDVRAATQTDRQVEEALANREGLLDQQASLASLKVIEEVFGPGGKEEAQRLFKLLEEATDLRRDDWPPALLRDWSEALIPLEACRSRMPELEGRWLNLLGYCLRPGYGFAADDWRVGQVWRYQQGGVFHLKNEMCRAEWWILWRRIAGGLNMHQQLELANPLIKLWRQRIKHPKAPRSAKQQSFLFGDHESAEVWRLLGSLERLPASVKAELGELILLWVERKGAAVSNGAALWALGRIGARQPSYGPMNEVVEAACCERWCERLIQLPGRTRERSFALMHVSRKTGDRYRDLSEACRLRVLEWMVENECSSRHQALVREGGLLDAEEQDRAFGEALPPGLHLAG